MSSVTTRVASDVSGIVQLVKDLLESLIQEHVDQEKISISVSGGSMVQILSKAFSKLSPPPDWKKLHFFYCDERHVPADDKESTHGAYKEALFSLFPIPSENVHNPSIQLSLDECAEDYANKLTKFFGTSEMPHFDLILLGIGPDGHTCSLFPDCNTLEETTRTVIAIRDSPKPPPERITLTVPVLNAAHRVVFITTGKEKAGVVKEIIHSKEPMKKYPATFVRPHQGEVVWILDEGAASQLEH